MEARLNVRRREFEQDIVLAWHIGAFSGAAANGKLKPLAKYLAKPGAAQTPREMMAVLQQLKAGGAGMTIRKVEREG